MHPLLFHGNRVRPTTREVAERVKAGGVAALSEAERRADQATYQEVDCRSALNRVKGMPFDWTLNPYRGCTHACHYCFARRYHTQFEMNAGDEFASVISSSATSSRCCAANWRSRHGPGLRWHWALRPIPTSPSRGTTGSPGGRSRR